MESNRYRRHISRDQKKLLVKLIKANPRELLTGTVTRDFSHQDFQRIWRQIAVQCNALPGGAEKTWKQWRKCWQDLRHRHQQDRKKPKVKKTIKIISAEERESLLKKISSATDDPDGLETEFAEFGGGDQDANDSDYLFEVEPTGSCTSDQDQEDMLPETKVFDQPLIKSKVKKSVKKRESRHSCEFNCETLASQEERKVQIKEDYYNFKKDYLTQKLKYMKDQSEALQAIARHLGERSSDGVTLNGVNM